MLLFQSQSLRLNIFNQSQCFICRLTHRCRYEHFLNWSTSRHAPCWPSADAAHKPLNKKRTHSLRRKYLTTLQFRWFQKLKPAWIPVQMSTTAGPRHLVVLVSGEGNVELCHCPILLRFFQFLLVKVILVLMSAAKIHHGLSNLLPYKQKKTAFIASPTS